MNLQQDRNQHVQRSGGHQLNTQAREGLQELRRRHAAQVFGIYGGEFAWRVHIWEILAWTRCESPFEPPFDSLPRSFYTLGEEREGHSR